jgi:tetratricopeptide (TPR) repeat protein
LGREAEARDTLTRAAHALEAQLAREREARAGAASARRGKRRAAEGASAGSAKGRTRAKEEWVDVQDGRRKIRALQEEGAFLDSFAEEPSGEEHLLDHLYESKLLGAQAARRVGDAEGAQGLLEEATRVLADRDEAWGALGNMALDAKDWAAAQAAFERAVGADPESAGGWQGLHRAAAEGGSPRRAGLLAAGRAPDRPAKR